MVLVSKIIPQHSVTYKEGYDIKKIQMINRKKIFSFLKNR